MTEKISHLVSVDIENTANQNTEEIQPEYRNVVFFHGITPNIPIVHCAYVDVGLFVLVTELCMTW